MPDRRASLIRTQVRADKHLIVIEGAAHGDFGGDAPGDAPNYVKTASAAFWDWCLNGSNEGRAWLDNGFAAFAGGAATITNK